MSFDIAKAAFNQADTNQDGQIQQNEFNQWISGGATGTNFGGVTGTNFGGVTGTNFDGATSTNFGGATGTFFENTTFSETAGANVTGVTGATGVTGVTGVQNYATDAQGNFIDPNPLVQRAAGVDCLPTYMQNIKVRYLQPPQLEPHLPITIKQVRPPQPPVPPPAVRRTVVPGPGPLPAIILRQRPPQKPAQNPGKTEVVTVANPPVPPRSVTEYRIMPLPAKPGDVFIELWRPYPPRGPPRRVVIPAPPPVPYPPPRNRVIIQECPPPRIEHNIERLADVAMDPETYNQQHGASLLDAAQITQRIRAANFPANFVEQLIALISSTTTVAANTGFAVTDTQFNLGGGLVGQGAGETTGVNTGVNGVDLAATIFNNADTNQDGNLSRSEFNQFFQQGL